MSVGEKQVPLCISCKHSSLENNVYFHVCKSPAPAFHKFRYDPVEGTFSNINCSVARKSDILCGFEGKLFEPK